MTAAAAADTPLESTARPARRLGSIAWWIVFIIALLLGPETKGMVMVSDITLAQTPQGVPQPAGTAD